MKKRTLSFLLLLAMLVTAIPISVAAESASAPTTEVEYYDLQNLYVTNGLIAHFSTFSKHASTVSLTDGTWTDIVSGTKATLGNAKYWEKRENGAVGFDILYGRLESDGTVTTTTNTAAPLATDRYSSNASSDYANTRLDFGIALLPKEDYSVEYLAKYNPVYVANPDGTVAKNSNGTPMEYYVKMGYGLKNANLAGAQDALGFFSSWAAERDGVYGVTLSARGAVLWMLCETLPATWNSGDAWIGYAPGNQGGMRGDFQIKDNVHTYVITRDESLSVENEARTVTATYSLVRDTVLYKKSLTVSTANTQPGRTYYDKDDTGAFYLSSQQPTDFYAVRIYDRVLSTTELEKNRLVDLLLYYDIKIPSSIFSRETLMDIVYRKIQDAGFVDDPFKKEALRAEIQATIDGEDMRDTFASLYAAPENLKELFTTYVPGSVDLEGGKWYSLLSNNFATFGSASRWSVGENGSVGFNTFCGMMDSTGNYSRTSSSNNVTDTSVKLHFGITMLPKDDFTVEYLAMYKPVYIYDGTAKDKIARDESGKPYEAYDFDPDRTGGAGLKILEGSPINQLGWFSALSAEVDGIGGKPWGEYPRGYIRWYFDCPTWYYNPTGKDGWGHNQNILVDGRRYIEDGVEYWMPAKDQGLNISTDVYRQNDVVRLYAITLDETLTIKAGGERETSGLFSLYRDTTLYNSNAGDLNTTATKTEKEGVGRRVYVDIDAEFDSCDFFLSAMQPTDFFTVRIYNKVLSEEEMLQNRAADLLYYYGVDVPADLKDHASLLVAIGREQAEMAFARDDAEYAVNKAILEQTLAEKVSVSVTVVSNGKTIDTIALLGNKLTLPVTFLEKQVIAWQVSGVDGTLDPGETVTVVNGATITPILFSFPTTEINPTVRMTGKEEDLGIRFAAAVSKKDYAKLEELYGADNISYGMLVAPASYVKNAGAFTREALTAYVASFGGTGNPAYIQINATGFLDKDENTYLLRGSVYDFKENTLKKNPAFAAVAFFDVDTDGDSVPDLSFYGSYIPLANSKVKETLDGAKGSFDLTQKAWIDTLLSRFGA